ncbi:hypothetical protein ISCGN_017416 [Ixodes scapularis]
MRRVDGRAASAARWCIEDCSFSLGNTWNSEVFQHLLSVKLANFKEAALSMPKDVSFDQIHSDVGRHFFYIQMGQEAGHNAIKKIKRLSSCLFSPKFVRIKCFFRT